MLRQNYYRNFVWKRPKRYKTIIEFMALKNYYDGDYQNPEFD